MQMTFQLLTTLTAVTALYGLIQNSRVDTFPLPRLTWVGGSMIMILSICYSARIIGGTVVQGALTVSLYLIVFLQLVDNSRKGVTGSTPVTLWVWLAPFISFTLFLVNVVSNPAASTAESLSRIFAPIFVTSFVLWIVICRVTVTQIAKIVASCVLAMIALSPLSGNAWRSCDQFKCGPFGAIYTGPFASENSLAIFCAVGVFCLLAIWRKRGYWFGILSLMFTLYGTESRTSQLATVVGLLAWWLVSQLRRSNARAKKSWIVWVFFIAGVVVTGTVLLYTSAPSDFSNRGNIWRRGVTALGEDWVLGLGLDRWTFLQSQGFIPGLFPHSQYLILLFSGGIICIVALFLLLAVPIIVSWNTLEARFAVGYSCFLGVLGMTETYWNPLAVDGQAFILLPLIVVLASCDRTAAVTLSITKLNGVSAKKVGRL